FGRSDRVLLLDPVNRLIRQVSVEIVVGPRVAGKLFLRFDGNRILEHRRVPLVGVAADESVKVVEAKPGRPQVERTNGAALPGGHIMVLAEPGGAVAVAAENLSGGARALRHHGIVSGVA